jgi:Zn-dependent membrane protease YugP
MLFGLVFQVVTLPCEFDASKRGLKFIEEYNMVEKSESKDAKKMLKAAAYTYIAGILSTILEILYYVARLSNRRD